MNLKNYTSTVAARETISYIEAYLAECGVTGITKQFENGQPVAIYFHIDVGVGGKFTVRLPARVVEVQEFLYRDYVASWGDKRRAPTRKKGDFLEQAARTAWKIQQDWVQVQMSLIKLKQADFVEVFMGFLWDGKQSYYEQIKAGGFKALPERTESQ